MLRHDILPYDMLMRRFIVAYADTPAVAFARRRRYLR